MHNRSFALTAIVLASSLSARAQGLPSAPMPGITIQQPTPEPLPLTLDDAIARGLAHNLQVELGRQNERRVAGEVLTVGNALLPSLSAEGSLSAREINLAAMGLKPAALAAFGLKNFNPVVSVQTASAQINLSQVLFNVPAYYLYRGAQKAGAAASYATLNARGGVTFAVASGYLRAVADAAQLDNDRALLTQDQAVLDQAAALHDAGVGINLDVLRARVQLQSQRQAFIRDENTLAKEKIALTRLIGLPAGQELALTDVVPFAELADLPLDQARELAYTRRKDYLQLLAELDVATRAQKAVRYEYAPTATLGGFYGVLGAFGSTFHGDFAARGAIQIPIFHQAEYRGEQEVAAAQVTGLRQQIAGLRDTIEQQIREATLDVQSARTLVDVALSNVQLSQQVLSDATDRLKAGVADNLPVVQAQATLAGSQARLVQVLYRYNTAKLQLARNIGVVETRYRDYLGK